MLSVRLVILATYVGSFALVILSVASGPATGRAPVTMLLLTFLFIVGLALLLGHDYILPLLFKNRPLGGACRIIDNTYIVCKKGGRYVGHVLLKVIPSQPVAKMDENSQKALLASMSGLLQGVEFDPIIMYRAVRDRYRDNIIKRLRRKESLLSSFAGPRAPRSIIAKLDRIKAEIDLLMNMPSILEGFYIAGATVEGDTVEEVIEKLRSAATALRYRLESVSTEAKIIKGAELNSIADFITFGRLVQDSIA